MKLYLHFLRYVRPYGHWIAAASLAFALSGFLSAFPIQLFRRAVDVALAGAPGSVTILYRLAGQYILLYVALSGVRLVEAYLSKRLAQKVVLDLRSDLYAHLQSLSIGFYETQGAGDIMSRALGDVGALESGFMGPLTRLAGELAQLAWSLYFLFRTHSGLTWVSLAIAPLLGYAVYYFGNRTRDLGGKMRAAQSGLWSFLAENISGIREIKIFGREEHELARFREFAQAADGVGIRETMLNGLLTVITGLLFAAGEVVILFLGGLNVYRGLMTAGDLTAFLMYVRLLYNPVVTIGRRYEQIQQTLAAAVRVFALFDTPPEVPQRLDAEKLSAVSGEVRFEGVSFGYRPGQEVLHDVSFVAAPGERVALVGHSGGGKTTMSKLVPRFYDPFQGEVRIDGRSLRDVSLSSLRAQIAVVFQEPFLFNGTVYENIAYGRPGATQAEVLAAARAANAHVFVEALPDGYETVVGQRGIKLSGGQRQRIAIARALLKDPRILILDEATSAVDSETEQAIQEALDRLLNGRTSLVIAHRLSTILHADRILVVEGGRIVEQGRHADLLAQEGPYSRLYHAQFKRQQGKRT